MAKPVATQSRALEFAPFHPDRDAVPHRRLLTDVIPSMKALAMDPAPFMTTSNAALFHARLRATNERVVVKRMPSLFALNGATNRCCDDPLRELETHHRVYERGGHPNIVRAISVVVDKETTSLVLEDCSAGDLYAHLQHYSENRMLERDALDVLLQVARGLEFLHQCDVAHRDVSVENVLMTATGECKLSDFGLSVRARVTSTEAVGKAHYMAPEVLTAAPYDPVRADIWSLGIVFFILLTGSPLVQLASANASDFQAVKALGGSCGVLKLWRLYDHFSCSTLDLLDGMLQPDPESRFRTALEVLEHPAMLAAAARRIDVDGLDG